MLTYIEKRVLYLLEKCGLKTKIYKEMALYFIYASLAALTDLSLLFILTSIIELLYWYSAAISFMIAGFVNYFLNKKRTFKNKYKEYKKQYLVFLFVAFTGLIWNQIIIYVLVEFVGFHYLLSKIFSLGIVFFWSFFIHKHITYGMLK